MSNKLKPCPFCGGKAEFSEDEFFCRYSVVCTECGAETNTYGVEQNAIDAWNNRVRTTPEFTPDELDEIKRIFDVTIHQIPISYYGEIKKSIVEKCTKVLENQ